MSRLPTVDRDLDLSPAITCCWVPALIESIMYPVLKLDSPVTVPGSSLKRCLAVVTPYSVSARKQRQHRRAGYHKRSKKEALSLQCDYGDYRSHIPHLPVTAPVDMRPGGPDARKKMEWSEVRCCPSLQGRACSCCSPQIFLPF